MDTPELPIQSLDALARQIRDTHALVGASVSDAVTYAITAGRLLLEAKAGVRRGEWLPWLERNCEMSERTAQVYMRMSKKTSTLAENPQRVADLTMRGALALLAKRKRTAADSDLDVKRAVENLDGPLGSHMNDVPKDDDIVSHHAVQPFDEGLAVRIAIEKGLPAGSAFFLLVTAPVDATAYKLVDELCVVCERLGWIVDTTGGARMIIGRASSQSLTRSASEVDQLPHGVGDAYAQSSLPTEFTLPIEEID